jgi:two-component system, cell cycle response regulator DivK
VRTGAVAARTEERVEMRPRLSSEALADLRQDAQQLVELTRDHAAAIEALVVATERESREAQAAASDLADLDIEAQNRLSQQLQRRAAGSAAARRLWAGATEQQAAASRLLAHMDGYHIAGEPRTNAVLVVDDQMEIREIVVRVLEQAGFAVRTAANGLEAVIAAYQMRPHVIVMDVSMPILDGIEATRLIKAGNATRHARVIAYTGNPEFEAGASRELFAAVLPKPTTPQDLLDAVQRVAGL